MKVTNCAHHNCYSAITSINANAGLTQIPKDSTILMNMVTQYILIISLQEYNNNNNIDCWLQEYKPLVLTVL